MASLGLRFDLRVPDFATTTHADQYRACVEMAEWADRLGLDALILSEHHGSPDGYLPAPLTLAGAILGRTKRIMVNVAAVLLPLHDPVRVAEQLAVLDIIAPGRISFVAALGYRDVEYTMAGVDRRQRGKLLDEYVNVLRKAWTGEPFEWRGREIVVTPKPATPGGPMIMIGGMTEAAARRAARLHCGFFPGLGEQLLADAYEDEATKVGFEGGFCSLPSGPSGMVFVADDPDALWEQIGAHVLYDAQIYSSWQRDDHASSIDVHDAQSWKDVRASGVYQILTPDECVELAETQGDFGTVMLHPLVGGVSPDIAWPSLEVFEQKVLPRLRPGV